jgi:ferredoxin-NADP reductase
MLATKITCRITEKEWLTPSVMRIHFDPSKKFKFTAGQFLSLIVPNGHDKPHRRAYSFSTPPGEGFELCVKHVKGGPGTEYLASLKVGDTFQATAPYGDFIYETKPGRNACFICTGTGIAPFRSMILSQNYKENPPDKGIMLFGAPTEEEIIYPGFFEKQGIETINALSHCSEQWKGYRGKVTDYLKSLSSDWPWHATDFYLCGNGAMVADVRRILRNGRGVSPEQIFQEVYFAPNGKDVQPVLKVA